MARRRSEFRRLPAVTVPPVDTVTDGVIAGARALLSTLEHQAAEQLVEHAALGRASRRRGPSGRIAPRRMRQCPTCRAFVSNPSRPCSNCGYLEGAGFAV